MDFEAILLRLLLFSSQISKVFEEEITPGFTLSHSKEHIDVTLGEEFFEKQKPTEETIKTTVPG